MDDMNSIVKDSQPSAYSLQSNNLSNSLDKIKLELNNHWNEFLLVSVEPTSAATLSLEALMGGDSVFDELKNFYSLLHNIKKNFIDALVNGSNIIPCSQSLELKPLIDLLKLYGKIFYSNFFLLNKAFLDTEGSESALITTENPKFNWSDVEKFNTTLQNIIYNFPDGADNEIIESICNCISDHAKKLYRYSEINEFCFLQPVQLRFILILLSSPFLDCSSSASISACIQFYKLVSNLPSQSYIILENWYTHMPIEIIRQHVANCHQLITLNIEKSFSLRNYNSWRQTILPYLTSTIKFLKVIFQANNRRKQFMLTSLDPSVLEFHEALLKGFVGGPNMSCQQALDLEEFYNDGINMTEQLIRQDFSLWKYNDSAGLDLIKNAFLLNAGVKAWYFFNHSIIDQEERSRENYVEFLGVTIYLPYFIVRVRRQEIVLDALQELTAKASSSDLKKHLKVIFDGEEGVDEGGVRKEFFQLLVEQIFNVEYGMFVYLENMNFFWFNSTSFESNLQFELIGMVIGLAINNGVILDIHFPMAVYKKLLGISLGLCDLEEFKPEVARSLRKLLLMPDHEIEMCSLSFSAEVNRFGFVEVCAISPNHSVDHVVTAENKVEYVECYIDWALNTSIETQYNAFQKGFSKCCDYEMLKLMLQPEELLLFICGVALVDFASIEKTVQYQDGYTKDSLTIQYFWEVAHSLSYEDKKRLLFFITGSDRIPIKGLNSLQISIGRSGSETNKLPTAHTCFNYLLLPDYKDIETLRKFLGIAIQNCTGFGLR